MSGKCTIFWKMWNVLENAKQISNICLENAEYSGKCKTNCTVFEILHIYKFILTTMLISWNNKERDKGMAYPFEYTHSLPRNLAKPQLQIGQRAPEEGCYGSWSQIRLP